MPFPSNASDLIAAIVAGKTLYVQTCTRTTKIDAKTVASWREAGRTLLKDAKGGGMLMAQGRKFVRIDLARLTLCP